MPNILFNHRLCEMNRLPRGGAYMHLLRLSEMDMPETGMCNFIQMTCARYRMTKETKDDSKWNGCNYEDIDYKFWMAEHEDAEDPIEVMSNVLTWLYRNCREILYYYELSRSGKGFHFIFYFAVNRNEHCRNMCKAVTVWAIRKAFHACGYGEIIDHPKVWDSCTNSIYQACFITKNKSKINDKCTGDVNNIIKNHLNEISKIYDEIFLSKQKSSFTSSLDKSDFLIDWERSDDTTTIKEYLSHVERWQVFNSLSGLCGDDDKKLKEEWEYCASRMVEQNGHTIEYYKEVPWSLDWDAKRTGNEYVNKDLLSKFGYNITIVKKTNIKENKTDYFKNMMFL